MGRRGWRSVLEGIGRLFLEQSTHLCVQVANTWGKEQIIVNMWDERKAVRYPEKGYFRILRGSNFCGIESQLCYAMPLKDRQSEAWRGAV